MSRNPKRPKSHRIQTRLRTIHRYPRHLKTYAFADQAAWLQNSDTFLAPEQEQEQEPDSSLLGVSNIPAAGHSPSGMAKFFFSPDSPNASVNHSAAQPPFPLIQANVSSSPVSSPLRDTLGDPFEANPHRSMSIAAPIPQLEPLALQKDIPDISLEMGDCGDDSVLEGSPVRPPFRQLLPRVRGPARAHSVALAGERCADVCSSTCLPGFGTFEQDLKTLPCHPVKCDGLMRITPDTLADLLQGRYSNSIKGFCVVDCRFAYEYEGGHIAGAINFNTVEMVRMHFLQEGQGLHACSKLPCRTQSGAPDDTGDTRKFLLVFHCEFSYKRGPSMALALRQADRALAHDYPNCHFPDVYVLEGGYASFFSKYPELCEPRAYVQMDDPRYLRRRSEELTGFRKQFSRTRSFAYGDGRLSSTESATLANSRLSVRRTLAFTCNSANDKENSPPSKAQQVPLVKRQLVRSSTTAPVSPTPILRDSAKLDVPSATRDTSFGSAGDSSFDADVGDSPCAVANSRRPFFEPHYQRKRAQSPVDTFSRVPMQRTHTAPSFTCPK